MGAFLDLPALQPGLKEFYDDQYVETLMYEDNPSLMMVPKKTNAGGKYIPIPVVWEQNQGRSSTFANAQGNQTPAQIAEFLLTRKRDYDVATIDNETLEASMEDKMSFLDGSTLLIDAAMRGLTLSCASAMFRDGTGTVGAISSITSGGVITLTNSADIVQFGLNQTLQANLTSGGSPRSALGYVVGRSVKNGTITVSATAIGGSPGLPASWAAGDSLLVQGDNNGKISGFPAWLPTTDPVSTDNFYGVNRSVDSRLFGLSYDGSGQPIEEAVIDHSLLLSRDGATIDYEITNFGTYGAVVKALGAKVQYVDAKGPGEIGFRGISINGAKKTIKMFPDRSCQAQRGFALQMNTWKLYSLGTVPKILRQGVSGDFMRVYNADAAEVRMAAYFNLGCNGPGRNGQTIFAV